MMTIDIGTTTASTTSAAAADGLRNQLLNENELVHRKKNLYISNCPDAYKPTSSSSSSKDDSDEKSTKKTHIRINFQFVYKFFLYLITYTILIQRRIKILLMQLVYSFLFVYDQLRMNLCKVKHSQFEFKQTPKHVLVMLNDNQAASESTLKKAFSLIVDFFFKLGVETITFYKFDDIPASVKEHLLDKYRDVNNNQTKANLSFYSYAQAGRCLFTRTCKNIALDVTSKQINLADINKELIDDYITESSKINEPQLILNIGATNSLAAFLPWHLRLSEIIKVPTINLVNSYTLNNVMFKYNKIEKRFGK